MANPLEEDKVASNDSSSAEYSTPFSFTSDAPELNSNSAVPAAIRKNRPLGLLKAAALIVLFICILYFGIFLYLMAIASQPPPTTVPQPQPISSYPTTTGSNRDLTEMKRVGNSVVGFVNIPVSFEEQPAEEGSTSLVFVDPSTNSVVTIKAYLDGEETTQQAVIDLVEAEFIALESSYVANIYNRLYTIEGEAIPVDQLGIRVEELDDLLVEVLILTTSDGTVRSFKLEKPYHSESYYFAPPPEQSWSQWNFFRASSLVESFDPFQ